VDWRLFLSRNDFHPIPVGIFYEINAHFWIFITDAAHLLVVQESFIVVIDSKCEMKLIIPQVIGFRMAPEPGQFQCMCGDTIAQKYKYETFIRRLESPGFNQA